MKRGRSAVEVEGIYAPKGPYSHAVRAGDFLFVSGIVPADAGTGEMVKGSIEEQAGVALENLMTVLKAAGAGAQDVVKTTVYLADMNDFAAMNAAYGRCFAQSPPARATVQVAGLPGGAAVEIDAVAYLGD